MLTMSPTSCDNQSEARAVISHEQANLRCLPCLIKYTATTSWLRVFAVCSLALSPAFTFIILIELLPLHHPSEGWKANWILWIRIFLSIFLLLAGVVILFTILVPASGLTLKHVLKIAAGTSMGFVLQILLLAQFWCFPVPFTLLMGNPAMVAGMTVCVVLCVRTENWRANPDIMKQAKTVIPAAGVQALFLIIYSLYNAIFLRVHGLYQLAFVLVLPVIKFVMNAITARVSVGIPAANGLRMVTVELFDALYLFKCMQSAGSLTSGVGLIAVDLLINVYHLRKLHKHVHCVKHELVKSGSSANYKDMIQDSIARVSAGPHALSQLLQAAGPSNLLKGTIVPGPKIGSPAKFIVSSRTSKKSASLAKLDVGVHGLLAECQHLVLIEFIECSVPMFYAIYMVILYHLPNAKFYPEMERFDAASLSHTVQSIALYALLEFASLLYVHAFLRWELNISALHLLSNILERENVMLQSVSMIWVIVVLQLTLQHTGTWSILFQYHLCAARKAGIFLGFKLQ